MRILLEQTEKAAELFAGWEETMITSCLQKMMGKIYVSDEKDLKSACAEISCFRFYAGEPDRALLPMDEKGFAILVPGNEKWAALIEETFPQAGKVTRYAIRKDTEFDWERLARLRDSLPEGYVLRKIDAALYEACLAVPCFADFVLSFDSMEHFLKDGLGIVCVKNGRIVSGASSFSRYREGIEIEVDTLPEERCKGLAAACSAALILECLDRGWYPSWDAQNPISVKLAQKLGYVLSHAYTAYELSE